MGRAIERLNALQVAKARKPGYYPDGGNLYLQVSPSGSKSWVFRYTRAGKPREMGLGSLTAFPLAEARQRAQKQRQLLADGIDPLTVKRETELHRRMADASIITFDKAAETYIASHSAGWRNAKHAEQWQNTLATYVSPVFGGLPVAQVNQALVLRVLEPIWQTKTETASRLRGRIEKILDWAKARGYRTGDNPAAWRGRLDTQLPQPEKVKAVTHHPALPWQEIGAFMRDLQAMPGTSAQAVRFIILTACRTSEALNAQWTEFDLEAKLWTIPAERMKAAKEHLIPLSDAALKVLEQARAECEDSPYVFPGPKGRPLSNMAGLRLLQHRMGRPDLTVHGFRSTFRDWAGEATNHPREVIEHALAHRLKDKAEAAYQRGTLLEKRRALMADWAAYCATVRTGADVIPLRAAMGAAK
jgi:integrase